MEGLLKDARKAFLREAHQRNDRKELSLEEKEGGERQYILANLRY